mgnify:CR=1 FL=1
MLISIAGSQGSGKSTVLKALGNEGCNIVERKTARSILNEWNVTLDAVNKDPDLKMAFQMELVDRKFKDEIEYAYADEVYFTERTFADLFTYALISFGQYNQYDEWRDSYFKTCKDACNNYSQVFYLESCFSDNIEKDGVRSTNQHYSRMVDTVMLEFTTEMIPQDKLSVVTTHDLDERVQHILSKGWSQC